MKPNVVDIICSNSSFWVNKASIPYQQRSTGWLCIDEIACAMENLPPALCVDSAATSPHAQLYVLLSTMITIVKTIGWVDRSAEKCVNLPSTLSVASVATSPQTQL